MIHSHRFLRSRIAGVFAALSVVTGSASAQLEPPSTGGIVALQQELRMLGHNKRVLMIGAHPDDEDTELLTLLVRGMGAEAAYLSLNRGEGGQNLIGPELGEALGLIRTEELLAARKLDGARQFFTRAYDFGYSKSLEETWRFWPRDSVLKDVVRIVREFQPQIIVSIFSGTPRDGHGQHQAAGWVAREVFKIAEDAGRFPDAGAPWRPLKLYQSTRFDSAATTLMLEGGEMDPAVGQTYRQIAMRGRSLHRSQDMGQLQRIGASAIKVRLIEDRTGRGEADLFAGVDTTLHQADSHSGSGGSKLLEYIVLVDSIRKAGPSASRLSRAHDALNEAIDFESPSLVLRGQLRHLEKAMGIASGVLVDIVSDDDRVVPGQRVKLTASVWNPTATTLHVARVVITSRSWESHGPTIGFDVGPRTLGSDTMEFTVSESAASTQPYFLIEPRSVGIYVMPGGYSWPGLPFGSPEISVDFNLLDSTEFIGSQGREAGFRVNDQAFGERRRPLIIIPRVDVKLDPRNELWSTAPGAHDFTVTLTHGARDSTQGTVTLEVPSGWPVPEPQRFDFTREDERETHRFVLRPPANLRPGRYDIRAVATDERGRRYDQGVFTVDYPHIRPRSWTQASTATINVASLELAHVKRIGYIRGASDRVPEALASVGLPIELLDHTVLERGDLSTFDAIIVGSRAYEIDSALVENNARLLAYARNGGLVIVQYQQQVFFNGNFAPYPLKVGGEQIVLDGTEGTRVGPLIGHDRVTDETAPVRIIDPSSAVVSRPNRISPADWEGWVQERGLYFARSWDEAYKPVLEMADPGDAPLRGGLLVARYGRGTYVYTGISFFRELPAGVPGAFRLFANLLALAESSVP
jgi:LmbE family N-acetylglucosaminyl deacetylase